MTTGKRRTDEPYMEVRPAGPVKPAGRPARKYGFLYVVGPRSSSVLKIGMAANVNARLKDLQRSSPVFLEVLWYANASYEIERKLHEKFRKYRSHGEWFDFKNLSGPVKRIRKAAVALGAEEVRP